MAKAKSQKNIYDEKSKLFLISYVESRGMTSQDVTKIKFGDLLKMADLAIKSNAGDDDATEQLEDLDKKLANGRMLGGVSGILLNSGNDIKQILATIKRGLTARGYATVVWEEGTYGIGFNKKETENAIYRTEARMCLESGGF